MKRGGERGAWLEVDMAFNDVLMDTKETALIREKSLNCIKRVVESEYFVVSGCWHIERVYYV
jgi:hypothetical protein